MKTTLKIQVERYFKNKERLNDGLARYILLGITNYCHNNPTYTNPITDDELAIGLYGVFNILECEE